MGGAAYPERGADSALTDSFIGISKAPLAKLIRGVLDGVAFNQHFTCDGATSFSMLAHSAARASSQSGLGRTIGPAGSIIGSR